MEHLRKNWQLILIGLATLILGIIAVVTAIKLYQIGRKPVAPTAPEKAPAVTEVVEEEREPSEACTLAFSIAAPSPTPTTTPGPTSTPTPTSTPGPTATPTPSPTPGPTATPTPAPTTTPTPGPTATPTPTLAPGVTPTATPTPVELPEAGFVLPTFGVVLGGLILLGLALILAL